MIVVSGCDAKYAPGVKALHNSIVRNTSPGEIEFYCFAHGDPELIDDLKAHGINTVDNPQFPPGTKFPKGGRWDAGVWDAYPKGMNPSEYAMPAMYSRLLIPSVFREHDRALWIDADCLVMQSLSELDRFEFDGHCMASTHLPDANGNFKSLSDRNRQGNDLPYEAHGTGTMLFNIPAWNERRITEKCVEIMNNSESGEMLAVVQSVLILATRGDFAQYGWEYMHDIKRNAMQPGTKIIHFPICVPWDEYDLGLKPDYIRKAVSDYWRPYAT